MTASTKKDTDLRWDVFTAKRPGLTRDPPPGKEKLMWVANSSTLIYGERDAILVDAQLTTEQSKTLADWIETHDRELTAIYITHGHGDHFFGLAPLLARFPGAKAFASPKIVKAMQEQVTSDQVDTFWRRLFPGEISSHLSVAEPLKENNLELEGHKLEVIDTGKTDADRSTSLHIPSVGLIVAGDVVYNGIHLYLGETDMRSRLEWISSLDKLEALKPKAVVAGHKVPENDDSPRNIAETRQYLRDFNRLEETTKTARELYDAMLEIYPDRANPGSLWGAANVAKKQK